MNNNLRFFVCIFILCLLPLKLNAAQKSPFYDPNITVSMDFQDAGLKDILKILSVQSGLNFIASEAVQERKITLYLDKVPIKEAMEKLFKANNLSYDLDNQANIFIVKDWGVPQIETLTQVFQLKYATVSSSSLKEEMAKARTATTASTGSSSSSPYSATSSSASPSSTGYSGSAGAASGKWNSEQNVGITEAVKKLLSSNGVVIEDYRTNSLIVTDMPSRMPTIARTIELLDVPVTQVLIEVEMLDVSKDLIDKLGVNWPAAIAQLTVPGTRETKFPFGDLGTSPQERSIDPKEGVFGGPGAGWDFGAWGANHFGPSILTVVGATLTLDFFRTHTDTKYLARPRLLTLNNEPAEISITKDEVVGKKETTVTPTTGGSTATVEFIRSTDLVLTREGTGIYLRVTPQVNTDTGEITMVINPKTSITSASPLFSTQADAEVRSTKSIVKVKDGETVMLGGILHTDKKVVTNKLPFLGDIPFLGALFRHKNQSKDIERELIVFITPHIVKDKNMELAKAVKRGMPPKKEESGAFLSGRQAAINTTLNSFEKNKK